MIYFFLSNLHKTTAFADGTYRIRMASAAHKSDVHRRPVQHHETLFYVGVFYSNKNHDSTIIKMRLCIFSMFVCENHQSLCFTIAKYVFVSVTEEWNTHSTLHIHAAQYLRADMCVVKLFANFTQVVGRCFARRLVQFSHAFP
jgi:hypothetical protein